MSKMPIAKYSQYGHGNSIVCAGFGFRQATASAIEPIPVVMMAQPWSIACPELLSFRCSLKRLSTSGLACQLRRHILPVPDMEATSLIRQFLALGTVWNIDRSCFSGTDTKFSQAVCGDGCHFPFDSGPALNAVHVLVRVFKARSC